MTGGGRMMAKTKQEFKREHSKGDMIKALQEQQKTILYLQYQLYMRDLLCNPCHEADRMQYMEKK